MSKEPTIVRESAVTPINSTGVASRRAESKIEEAVENYVSGEGMWINQYLRGRGDYDKVDEATQIPTGNVVGAQAVDSEFVVRHLYMIFATPSFMAGGLEGL